MTVAAFQQRLKHHGLAVPSIHAGYDSLRGDLGAVPREASSFVASFVVRPSVGAQERRTADEWKRVCGTLARAGRDVRSHGLALALSQPRARVRALRGRLHAVRSAAAGNRPGRRQARTRCLLGRQGRTRPRALDPDHADRIALVHLKDLGRGGATVELGAGVLAIEQIVRAALANGTTHLFVEQDDPADPLRSIAISLRFLAGLPADVRPRPG